jgi:diguanylate cyclase (GGDEF)-like protein
VVVFIGLDHFKLINDTLGHAVGDRVLVAVAERLLTIDEPDALVGRFGGDEFVLIFPERDDVHSGAVIDRIVSALTTPLEVLDTLHYLTPSVGWGAYPQAGDDAGSMLKNVDLAMYQAKQRGRNNVMRYASELSVTVAERLRLVSRLRRALAGDEFMLHFQPKFRASDLAPTGLEALLRWNDPDRGLVAPGDFIGVAEDSGLIVPIGRWVLREAARHHRLLAEAGLATMSIAVNVSPPQFQRGDLFNELRALLAEFALPAGALEIELTENVILDNPEAAIEQMQRLRALGVTVAIDDFGTGYSSLGYLRRLPVDVLKIDRSFVADLDGDAESAAVCAAIIGLAHDLGRTVIAEGVETQAQHAWLRAHGCDGVQGFLFAHPMPFEQAREALARR